VNSWHDAAAVATVQALQSVQIGALAFDRFSEVLEPEQWKRFSEAADQARDLFAGRVIWNVNSTARGGGVAEMLVSLLAYARGVGVNTRWEVIAGNPDFFALTKRIHNNLHGAPGDGGELGERERGTYAAALEPNIREFTSMVSTRDVVIVHDPQPAGLVPPLVQMGVPVIWRCHVGLDHPNDLTRKAWNFLRPYVAGADALVFSRKAFVWEDLPDDRIHIIAPSIDAFSPKNQELAPEAVKAILEASGIYEDGHDIGDAVYTRVDGSPARVASKAQLWQGGPLSEQDRYALQVSRWDRLKDPLGVIQGFVDHIAPTTDAHLVYAGPAVEAVSDDPEGGEVLSAARDYFDRLEPDMQRRVHLAALPMGDLEENAAIVNALQREAAVIVQKSVAEGFGLTVAEGMWKARPVVASRIGGIQDQIVDGESGVLVDDPKDLAEYGAKVTALLEDPDRAARIGRNAMERVREDFLGVRSLFQYLRLIEPLLRD
jgi:trehalose synthase